MCVTLWRVTVPYQPRWCQLLLSGTVWTVEGLTYVGLNAVLRFSRVSNSCSSGAVESKCRLIWRALMAIVPPISKSLAWSFLGSQHLAFLPAIAILAVQVRISAASDTMWHQSSMPANDLKGRFARPVSLALRIMSSLRSRKRWRISKAASAPITGSSRQLCTGSRRYPRSPTTPRPEGFPYER